MGCNKNSSKREVYRCIILSQPTIKISNKQQAYFKKEKNLNNLTLHLKQLEKEEQTKRKVTKKERNHKYRAE